MGGLVSRVHWRKRRNKQLEYWRLYGRSRRARARAAGLCFSCRRYKVGKYVMCRRCRARGRSRKLQYWKMYGREKRAIAKAAGLCITCKKYKVRGGHSNCRRCRAQAVMHQARRNERKRLAGICLKCYRRSLPGRSFCRGCLRSAGLIYRRRRRLRAKAGLCAQCGYRRVSSRRHCAPCRAYDSLRSRLSSARVRQMVLKKYGAFCHCCGLSENQRFLTIDHVRNDGSIDRKSASRSGDLLRRILREKKQPHRFQILCWNCNLGKAHNGGICPHVTARRPRGPAALRGAPGRRPAAAAS